MLFENQLNDFRFAYLLATAEAVSYLSVIAKIDESFQTVQNTVIVVVEFVVVDDECVELIVRFKTSHLAEEASCRLGGNPEHLWQREERLLLVFAIVHLACLDSIYHHFENA